MRASEAPRCEGPRWSRRVPVRSGRLVCGVLSRTGWTQVRGSPSAINREEVCGDDAYRRASDETLISTSSLRLPVFTGAASRPALRLSLSLKALAIDADDDRMVQDAIEHRHRIPCASSSDRALTREKRRWYRFSYE